jgi:hypothetical protein
MAYVIFIWKPLYGGSKWEPPYFLKQEQGDDLEMMGDNLEIIEDDKKESIFGEKHFGENPYGLKINLVEIVLWRYHSGKPHIGQKLAFKSVTEQ